MNLGTALIDASLLASTLIASAAVAYLLVALWCVSRFETGRQSSVGPLPAVTVFKPLCGDEPGLIESLRSFGTQDYPGPLQIVFGVRSSADPAHAIVQEIQREFPHLDLKLVIDATVHGPNSKVSNLINMERAAAHDVWVVSDSDVQIGPDCLSRVVAHLSDPEIGAVTCLFRGRPRLGGNWVSQLGALFIDAWFLPAAIVDATIVGVSVCYGPVTAIRRSVLEAKGGFRQLSHVLADDTELGHVTTREGKRIAIAPIAVDTIVPETELRSLLHHELRWARTTRALRPFSYVVSLVTHALPIAFVAFAIRPSLMNGLLFGSIAALRAVVLAVVDLKLGRAATSANPTPWFLMLREVLYVGVWAAAFASRRISWRGRSLSILPGARLADLPAIPDATDVDLETAERAS